MTIEEKLAKYNEIQKEFYFTKDWLDEIVHASHREEILSDFYFTVKNIIEKIEEIK